MPCQPSALVGHRRPHIFVGIFATLRACEMPARQECLGLALAEVGGEICVAPSGARGVIAATKNQPPVPPCVSPVFHCDDAPLYG